MDDSEVLMQVDLNLFDLFYQEYVKDDSYNKDFLRKVFIEVDKKYKLFLTNASLKQILVKNPSIFEIASYILEEYTFTKKTSKNNQIELENDILYFNQLVALSFDKLVYNEFDNVMPVSLTSKYSCYISNLNMFINRDMILVSNLTFSNEKEHLLIDMFKKCFLLMKSSLDLLVSGLATESLSIWRTLHDLECVLKVVYDGNNDVSKAYYRHLQYGSLHRNEIVDQNEIARITSMMEKDMLDLEVKKANKEKFINYGWMHWAYKNFNGEEVKMNFLGGLQKIAQLTQYRKYYEFSSDVTHSTPLLIYANNNHLTYLTIQMIYETFFRVELMLLKHAISLLKENNPKLQNYMLFKNIYKDKLSLLYSLILFHNK